MNKVKQEDRSLGIVSFAFNHVWHWTWRALLISFVLRVTVALLCELWFTSLSHTLGRFLSLFMYISCTQHLSTLVHILFHHGGGKTSTFPRGKDECWIGLPGSLTVVSLSIIHPHSTFTTISLPCRRKWKGNIWNTYLKSNLCLSKFNKDRCFFYLAGAGCLDYYHNYMINTRSSIAIASQ